MGKNAKEKFDVTMKTVTEKAQTKTGKIVIVSVLAVILVLNIFWTMMKNSVSAEVQSLKGELTTISARIAEVEKGSVNLEAVKADAEHIKKAAENFEAKLNAVVKAEEAKLEILAKEMENQKAYIEDLKSLLAGETGK